MNYKNRKVLITGDTGFKGVWMSLMLLHDAAKLLGISNGIPNNNDFFYNKANIKEKIEHKNIDIRDIDNLKTAIKKFKPDYIFHLAAQPIVSVGYSNPKETIETNVMGTVNILECLRELENITCVIITTDKVYKNDNPFWGNRECDALGVADPYSTSKTMVELVVQSYKKSYNFAERNIKIVTARGGNVIGGGDWAQDRIIPDFIKSKVKNEILNIRNPHFVRPWMYVLDLIYGYLLLGNYVNLSTSFDNSWNFGPNKTNIKTVAQLINGFATYFDNNYYTYETDYNRLKESNLLLLDSTQSQRHLKWEPNFGFERMLLDTATWYKNVFFNNMDAFCESLIAIRRFFVEIKHD